MKAMEKLQSGVQKWSNNYSESLVKTYEDRLHMTEERTKIAFELREQALQDTILVLKEEIAEQGIKLK